ncbi:hypothetical protein M8494_31400 [Serratia ureilytica]
MLMVAMAAGVELAFETMVDAGIIEESAYYESLHELPLIANTIARKRLYEMNVVISDTAEYGNYLFANAAVPLLKDFMTTLQAGDLGKAVAGTAVDNAQLRDESGAQPPYRNRRPQTAWLHDRHETHRRCGLISRKAKHTEPAAMPAFMPMAARSIAVRGSAGSRVWRWRPQLTHRIADVKLHRAGLSRDQRDLMVGFARLAQ